MPEYDFYATVRGDLSQLERELASGDIQPRIDALAGQLGVGKDVALAVLWRSSKRHGETLSVFVTELADQLQRETARQNEPAGATAETGAAAASGATTPQVGDTAPRL